MDTNIKSYAHVPPPYQEALELLQNILNLQTGWADKAVSSLQIDRVVAHARWSTGRPLLTDERPTPSPSWFRGAVDDLHGLLPPGTPVQAALDRLICSNLLKPPNIDTLLGGLFDDSDACIQQMVDATSTPPDIQVLLLQTILTPFYQKQIAPYRAWFDPATWRRSICPMCGSEPRMARLSGENGQRFLACFLCRTEWRFDRLRCPFCEKGEQPQLRYFTLDGDQAHRVDCCDHCHRYIKTVDERVLGYPTNLLVEDVITAPMEGLAREHGFQ